MRHAIHTKFKNDEISDELIDEWKKDCFQEFVFKLRNKIKYENIVYDFGLEGDDFIENKTTYRATLTIN